MNEKISVYGLLVYIGLKISAKKSINCLYFNTHSLFYYLYGSFDYQRNIMEYLQQGIKELIDNEIIKIINCNDKEWVIETQSLFTDTHNELYVVVEQEEILKILNSKYNCKPSLLRYFLFLIGTISNKIRVYLNQHDCKSNVIGNLTIDYLSNLSSISKRTIIEYNKFLEELELIYISRQNDFCKLEEGKLKSLPNVYGRFCDKYYIDQFSVNNKEYLNAYNHTTSAKKTANSNRGLSKKYYYLCQGKEYTKEEIKEIYDYIVGANEKYIKLKENTKSNKYDSMIKDTKIFEKYIDL